jgi:hypothetical protein
LHSRIQHSIFRIRSVFGSIGFYLKSQFSKSFQKSKNINFKLIASEKNNRAHCRYKLYHALSL